MSVITTTTSLADPETRGEDLEFNYRLATAIAPERCPGCARYHINYTLGRLVRLRTPYGSDQIELTETIERLFVARAARPGPVTIAILGTAETGIPALVAHLALKAGLIDRTEFVIVDLCPTPLRLCREFAQRNGLRMRTVESDVIVLEESLQADFVLLHSLLRFIPADSRIACLRRWHRWLKPHGRMIVSNTFAPTAGRDRHSPFTEGLRALVERDAIALAEPKGDFLARLAQEPPWPVTAMTETDLLDLFGATGLPAEEVRTVKEGDASLPGERRGRTIAVFGSA